jgi:hypothetical protein
LTVLPDDVDPKVMGPVPRNAVLLRTRKTELAPPTDAAREPDPDQPADF